MYPEVKYQLRVVKCPKCSTPIHLSVGRFTGGINDDGGMIIQCEQCTRVFPCRLQNPMDASGVIKNGRKLAAWLDDLPAHLVLQYGIDRGEMDRLDVSIVTGYEQMPAVQWKVSEDTFFKWEGENLEGEANLILHKYSKEIASEYRAAFNFHVKGNFNTKKSFVLLEYEQQGRKSRAVFAKTIAGESDFNMDNLYLVDHSDADIAFQIDGLYTRDQIMVFLERLLNRWRYTAQETILVVPFIGFPYPKSSAKLGQLWDWLVMNVDVATTKLITRKGTFGLYKLSQERSVGNFQAFVELGLVEPLIEQFAADEAEFFEKSHAKFYVGIYEDYVEVLSGSFNIHTGKYLENVTFKRYDKDFFIERYLKMIPGYKQKEAIADTEEDLLPFFQEGPDSEAVHFIGKGESWSKNFTTELNNIISFCQNVEEEPKF